MAILGFVSNICCCHSNVNILIECYGSNRKFVPFIFWTNVLCLFHFRKNRKKTWNQQRKKTAVFFTRTNLRKSQQSFIQNVLKTSVELLRRTMILMCKKRFQKSHELERLYWHMLIVENDSQINEKVLIHNLQTVKV